MPSSDGVARPAALDEFMVELRELRSAAGEPSFRRMAEKSGAVSHATLHLAVTGRRLQPWETVREFVRACDGDEEKWHARWSAASAALTTSTPSTTAAASEAASTQDPGESADGTEPVADDDGALVSAQRPWWRRTPLIVAAVVVAIAAISLTVVWLNDDVRSAASSGQEPADRREPKTADGPVYPGDASKAGPNLDVTYPDGTRVRPDETFTKTWQLSNVGRVEWRDRYLERLEPNGDSTCVTAERVPINVTQPGERVRISVDVRAPDKSGVRCKIHWKMVDESGRVLMPSYRPIFFDVTVR